MTRRHNRLISQNSPYLLQHAENPVDWYPWAEEAFEKVFKDKGTPDDIPEVKVKKGTKLVDALASAKIVASKSEARRVIEQGGVKIDDQVVSDVDAEAEEGVYKIGKRKFVRILF